MARKRKENKRYPYISVKGTANQYLDACLLSLLDGPALCKSLVDEKALISKTNLSLTQILKQNVSKKDLVRELSPYLSEHYTMYNFLVQVAHGRFQLIEEINEGEEDNLVLWMENIEDAIKYEQITIFTYINWLRFDPRGHQYLKQVFEKYGHEFEQETGLILSDDFQLEELVVEKSEEESIDAEINRVIQQLQSIKAELSKENLKHQYEEVLEQNKLLLDSNKSLHDEIKTLKDQVKSKEQVTAKKDRDFNKLKKEFDSATKKLDKSMKEAGQLGGEVGKLRQKVDEVTKQMHQFESEVKRYKEEREILKSQVEERLTQQWSLERAALKDDYQRDIYKLQIQNQALQAQVENGVLNYSKQDEYENEIDILRKQISLYTQQLKKLEEESQKEIAKLRKQLDNSAEQPASSHVVEPLKKQEPEDDFDLDDILGELEENEPTPI
ncbi:hypothetical protein [Neobacillus sp. NPDC093127]|uniref:hypothetical protein n=1 Tax=Neobacillus sp. NPDC093127 TaxID=3364296 RepID=UPI00381EAC5F